MSDHRPTIRINPFTDYGFKRIFGREESKPVLMKFLNELFEDEADFEKIVDITYEDKEIPRISDSERTTIYDVLCTTSSGKKFIVEMQNRSQAYFTDRLIYCYCKSVVEQEVKGDWDFNFKPVYMIAFQNFVLPELGNAVRVESLLWNMTFNKPMSRKARFINIQLPLFHINDESECKTAFDKWLYFLLNMETMNTLPSFAENDSVFKQLVEMTDYYSLSKDERRAYDRSLKAYRDARNQLRFAQEEGRAEGRAEGLAEGRAEGRAEEKQAIILNMHDKGMDVAVIAQLTLTSEEIIRKILSAH